MTVSFSHLNVQLVYTTAVIYINSDKIPLGFVHSELEKTTLPLDKEKKEKI